MIFLKHENKVFAHDDINPFPTDGKRNEKLKAKSAKTTHEEKRTPQTKTQPEPLSMSEILSSPLLAGAQGEEIKRNPETDRFASEAKAFFSRLPVRSEVEKRIEYLNKFKRAITKEIHQINAPLVQMESDSVSASVSVIEIKEVAPPCISHKQVLSIMLLVFVTLGTCWFVFDEGNSFIDALYLVIIIITTVGYGLDDYMEDSRNQTFLIFYIIFGVALITAFLNIIFVGMLDGLAKKRLTFFDAKDSDCFTHTTITEEYPDRHCFGLCKNHVWEKFVGVLTSTTAMITGWLVVLLGGAFIIGMYEGWDSLRSVYFAVVSGSTVGFGDFAPESQGGRMVCIIWLPVCIAMTANAFGKLISSILDAFVDATMNELSNLQDMCGDLLNVDNFEQNLELMDIDGDGELTEAEFITQTLINEYQVPPKKLQLIKAYFQELDTDHGGTITKEDFKRRQHRVGKSKAEKDAIASSLYRDMPVAVYEESVASLVSGGDSLPDEPLIKKRSPIPRRIQ